MKVQGSDCSIVIKTAHREMDLPYSDETIREAVSFLQEEASIEGDSICKGIRIGRGVTGCVVTPLTIGTAPLLLYLAMGNSGLPVFVSETRNLYRHCLSLLPFEEGPRFDLVQKRGDGKWLYEGCGIASFEMRIQREEAIKIKFDISGENNPVTYPYNDDPDKESGERFNGDGVTYKVNGTEYRNIYGMTINAKKEEGTKTELRLKRSLEVGPDMPNLIDELTVTAQLYQEKYEFRYFGSFRLTMTRLVLLADETNVDTSDTVVGPIRYYVAGTVKADVFSFGEGIML